jgi:hypothetical protein
MSDSKNPQRSTVAANAEKVSAEQTQAELEKLSDLDLDKVVGGATKKSTLVIRTDPTIATKKFTTITPTSTTTIKR